MPPAMKAALERPLKPGRHFLLRLPGGCDILGFLTEFCAVKKVRCAAVSLIGATYEATIGYYDQVKHAYARTTYRQEMEIVSCTGNVSLKDGKPFLHLHAVLGDTELRCFGGHLFPGSKVFAAEAHVQELKGARARVPDPATGLALWCP